MKPSQMGLCSVWLTGLTLIALSLYATQKLPSLKPPPLLTRRGHRHHPPPGPTITLFTAPGPFSGAAGDSQRVAIRSWLGLSPDITVVLFSQDASAASSAGSLGPRVIVDGDIDFTFLGTPFFHSMMARSRSYESDVSVFIYPETILLPDFIASLSFLHKLDHDWLLVASPHNISHFPFRLNDDGTRWQRENGNWVKTKELQEILSRNLQRSTWDERLIMAWNSRGPPLHTGILPPFLFGKGIHNHWVINEALSSQVRFVFDASWSISSFYLDHSTDRSNELSIKERSWEYVGNSHLGALYGSSFFRETNFSSLVRLFNCYGRHIFIDPRGYAIKPLGHRNEFGLLDRRILHSWRRKRVSACVERIKSSEGRSNWSLKHQLKASAKLNFPFSLESLLSGIVDGNKTIVLSVAGYSYKDMMMSWVCRMRLLKITNFVICALDREIYEFSVLQGLPVFRDSSAPNEISFDNCHFGSKCFQRVTKVKSRIVLKILKLGYNVLLSDVDVYWFQNPIPLLSSFGRSVIAAQSDEYNKTGPINMPRRLNSGFYFVHSDSSTVTAMEKVVKHAATSGLSEQPSFYDMLCGEDGLNRVGDNICIEPESNVTVHFLDRDLFPNGTYEGLWEKRNVREACLRKGCLVIHNNWISGRRKKLKRQVASGLWDYDVSTRMCKLGSKSSNHWLVHAGGRTEMYQQSVSVAQIVEKYPGMCVARPEVFKNPKESILREKDKLLVGHKYFLIPSTTVKKLRRRQEAMRKGKEQARDDKQVRLKGRFPKGGTTEEEPVSSAKDSEERGPKCSSKRKGTRKKPFVPPIQTGRPVRSLGWEPSLHSVQELSPDIS